jgi:hypothetical protein
MRRVLDYEIGARIVVEFTIDRRKVVGSAVIFTVDDEDKATVRVYDGTHGADDTGTIAAAGRRPQGRSMPVLLGIGCGPRSPRFAPITRR